MLTNLKLNALHFASLTLQDDQDLYIDLVDCLAFIKSDDTQTNVCDSDLVSDIKDELTNKRSQLIADLRKTDDTKIEDQLFNQISVCRMLQKTLTIISFDLLDLEIDLDDIKSIQRNIRMLTLDNANNSLFCDICKLLEYSAEEIKNLI